MKLSLVRRKVLNNLKRRGLSPSFVFFKKNNYICDKKIFKYGY